jgi:hypothetical protein
MKLQALQQLHRLAIGTVEHPFHSIQVDVQGRLACLRDQPNQRVDCILEIVPRVLTVSRLYVGEQPFVVEVVDSILARHVPPEVLDQGDYSVPPSC